MRVDYSDVQAVLSTDVEKNVITALIEDAEAWVDAHLDGKLADATLKSVQKYLAAHMVLLVNEGGDGQLTQSTRSDITDRYAERKGNETSYLRTAAALDSTGTVREHWLGGKRVMFKVGAGYACE